MDKVKQLADELYNQKVLDGWKNVSMETCLKRATDYYRMNEVVKKLTIPVVGWRSEQLPEFDIDAINEIIEECKENKDSLETLISRVWNRGLITGVNSEAEINSK